MGKDKKKPNQQMLSTALLGCGLDLKESGKRQMGKKKKGESQINRYCLEHCKREADNDREAKKDKGKLNQQTVSAALLGGHVGYGDGGGGGHSQGAVDY